MKTPCLKCGLIHDEPTAICDGYVGIDPDETAGDTRKKAAARIRAVLAAVPIESRGRGRARGAAAGAGTGARGSSPEPTGSSAGGPVQTEALPAEVPEWRREVTERLESYRSRRERQARQGNQTVLGFRVHSRTETLEDAPEAEAPATTATGLVSEAIVPHTIEEVAAQAVAPAAAHSIEDGEPSQRVYQPIEESDATADLTAMAAETTEHGAPAACAGESAEATNILEMEASAAPAALPLAEPAVVLADSTTLEVHADPAELAGVQSPASAARMEIDALPLATIPAIDVDYWRAQPGPTAEALGEGEECGTLTSGFEANAIRPAVEAAQDPDIPGEPLPVAAVLSEASDEAPPSQADPQQAVAASAETVGGDEPLFPGALEASGDEEEEGFDPRRAALRTAARPPHNPVPERIEINVPQPVFDFSAASVETQQPQEQGPPVADLRERRCAAIFDTVILGATIAGFFGAFHLAGGEFSFSRVGAAVGMAAGFLIYAQYILLFTMVGGATPGMLLRGLRVVCFDGRLPEQVELTWRGFGYLLSAAAGMLGFVWAAWDEHGLTWHDRISQTYITYAEAAADPVAASAS